MCLDRITKRYETPWTCRVMALMHVDSLGFIRTPYYHTYLNLNWNHAKEQELHTSDYIDTYRSGFHRLDITTDFQPLYTEMFLLPMVLAGIHTEGVQEMLGPNGWSDQKCYVGGLCWFDPADLDRALVERYGQTYKEMRFSRDRLARPTFERSGIEGLW